MAYTKTIWADGENKYNITDQSNNILSALENVKLTNIGSVGTPISAANLNNIESEVKASSDRLASILATQSDVSIGTNSTQAVTPLTLRGLTIASAVPSENLRASSDSIAQVSSNSVYVKKKAFTIVTPGTYRVKFDMQSSGSGTAYCLIYKNGVAFGTERSVTTSGYVTFTEDLVFAAGDTCEVWIKAVITTAYVNNFRSYFDVAYSMNFDPSVSTPSISYEIA